MPTVCAFAASSRDLDAELVSATRELGRRLARDRWDLVFGGANIGLMNAIAAGFVDEGAQVVSVIPEVFAAARTFADSSEVLVTPDLRRRKDEMDRRADAFLTLPGGIGTLDETCEILTLKQIGLSAKPLVVWDYRGHYARLFELIDELERGGFCPRGARDLFVRAATADDVVAALRAARPGPATS